jgi:hypothetical protein
MVIFYFNVFIFYILSEKFKNKGRSKFFSVKNLRRSFLSAVNAFIIGLRSAMFTIFIGLKRIRTSECLRIIVFQVRRLKPLGY